MSIKKDIRQPITGTKWLGLIAVVLLLAACNDRKVIQATATPTAVGVATATPVSTPEVAAETPVATTTMPPLAAATTAVTSAENTTGIRFAASLPVPQDQTYARNADAIRQSFRELHAHGITVVGQFFASDSVEADWQVFFDIAAEEGIGVIPAFEEAPRWNGDHFDLGITGELLNAMHDHPALYAIAPVDEPFHARHNWEITATRLQQLYRQLKEIAPNTPVYVPFSREIWKGEQGRYGSDYVFKSGMCDICVISTLEFRNFGDGNKFDSDTALQNHAVSRAVIRREDPDAQIWTTIQAFGSVGTTEGRNGSSYYMPDADEFQAMIDLLLSPELQNNGELDGIMWQQWQSRGTQQDQQQYTLADPQFAEHRTIITETAARLGIPIP